MIKHAEFIERTTFTKEELLALSQGNLVEDAPAEFIRLPTPPMLSTASGFSKDSARAA